VDSVIHYYGPSPIILTGDNRSIQIAPNNSLSPTLPEHIKKAGIPVEKQFMNSYTQVLCKPILNSNTYSLTKPDDFNVLVLPPKEGQPPVQDLPLKNLMAPEPYIKELEERYAYFNQFKTKVSQSNLSQETVKVLHSVFQGNFKEWLTSRGYTKNLNDLVKMIEKTN